MSMKYEVVIPDGYEPVSVLTEDDPRGRDGCMVILIDKEYGLAVYALGSRPRPDNREEVAQALCGGWKLWYVPLPKVYNCADTWGTCWSTCANEWLAEHYTVAYFKELEPLNHQVAESTDGVD